MATKINSECVAMSAQFGFQICTEFDARGPVRRVATSLNCPSTPDVAKEELLRADSKRFFERYAAETFIQERFVGVI